MENKKKHFSVLNILLIVVILALFIAAIFAVINLGKSINDGIFVADGLIFADSTYSIGTADSFHIENGNFYIESIQNEITDFGRLKKMQLNDENFVALWTNDQINKTSAKEICGNATTAYSAESDGEKIILVFLRDKDAAVFSVMTDENGRSHISKGYKLRESVGRTARYAADPESVNPLAAPYFTLDEENGEFAIKFSYLSSGFDHRGKYELSDNGQILTLCVTSSEKYIFEKCDGGYAFNADESSEVPEYKFASDEEPTPCFEDGAVFAYTGDIYL